MRTHGEDLRPVGGAAEDRPRQGRSYPRAVPDRPLKDARRSERAAALRASGLVPALSVRALDLWARPGRSLGELIRVPLACGQPCGNSASPNESSPLQHEWRNLARRGKRSRAGFLAGSEGWLSTACVALSALSDTTVRARSQDACTIPSMASRPTTRVVSGSDSRARHTQRRIPSSSGRPAWQCLAARMAAPNMPPLRLPMRDCAARLAAWRRGGHRQAEQTCRAPHRMSGGRL